LTFRAEGLRVVKDYMPGGKDPRMIIYSIMLIVLMLTRPEGLLGRRELWQVLSRRKDTIPDEEPPRDEDAPPVTQKRMANELLVTRDVTIRFGGLTAVSDFNLAIRPHELIGLIGPNGAGKTTVFNILTGVYKPSDGTIEVSGVPTANLKPYAITALGVARTFQNIRLFKELTVLDNVKIGGHIHYAYSGTSAVLHTNRFQKAEQIAEDEALRLLSIFGLESRARYRAKNLPYGDQRSLEIAGASGARPHM